MIQRSYLLVPFSLLSCLWLLPASPSAEPGQADGEKQPAPRLATLHGNYYPLKTALADLDQQTTNLVADQMGDPDPVFNLKPGLEGVTFWQALDAIAEKAGGRVDLHPREGGIALTKRPAGWKPPLVSHSGLFRITLNALTSKLDLESDARACTASVEVAWEPHLLPLLLETRPRSLKVQDDAGKAVPVGAATSSLAPVDGRTSLSFDVALPSVERGVKKLSLVEGELYAVAPTKMLTFSFDALTAAPGDARLQQTQEEVECRVARVVEEDDRWSVAIELEYPEGNVHLDSYQSWVVNNEIYLEGKDGDRLPSSSYLLEGSTPRHATLTYHFTDKERMKRGLGVWKLVYRTPALVVKVPIQFSFRDVPLP